MIALCFSSFLIHCTTLVSQNYLVCLAEEQQIVYISRFYSIAALCITFTEMCLLSFETSSLLFYCFRFYFLLMMDIAKSETFKNFIILNKALLFLINKDKFYHIRTSKNGDLQSTTSFNTFNLHSICEKYFKVKSLQKSFCLLVDTFNHNDDKNFNHQSSLSDLTGTLSLNCPKLQRISC